MARASYDSRPDTWEHIHQVQRLIHRCIESLLERAAQHDQSKLRAPEVGIFDVYTPRLASTTYGSPAYAQCLAEMHGALEHHYAENAHHPEHYPGGVADMSLLDVLEMLCDWIAASRRHADGDVRQSIVINQSRFGFSDELRRIMENTLPELGQ